MLFTLLFNNRIWEKNYLCKCRAKQFVLLHLAKHCSAPQFGSIAHLSKEGLWAMKYLKGYREDTQVGYLG